MNTHRVIFLVVGTSARPVQKQIKAPSLEVGWDGNLTEMFFR